MRSSILAAGTALGLTLTVGVAEAATTFAVPNPYASSPTSTSLNVGRLRVFGDSYSALSRRTFPNWVEQLRNADGMTLEGYAVSNATANDVANSNTYSTNTFINQVQRFTAANTAIGSRDLTSVYFGYNDLGSSANVPNSIQDYDIALDRLVRAGLTSGSKRIMVMRLHDLSLSPYYSSLPSERAIVAGNIKQWNAAIDREARSRQNVIPVDLYTVFQKVVASPRTYGLTNITTADNNNCNTTALYCDIFHFGQRGQQLISQTVRYTLTRGWDMANTIKVGAAAVAKIQTDIANGRVISLADQNGQELGVTAMLVGNASSPDSVLPATSWSTNLRDHANADATDGGFGVGIDMGGGTKLGFIVSDYDGQSSGSVNDVALSNEQTSQGFTMQLDQEAGVYRLKTLMSFTDDAYAGGQADQIFDLSNSWRSTGSSTRVQQMVSRPFKLGDWDLEPSVALGWQQVNIDGFTRSSLYASDETFGDTQASRTDITLGLGASTRPYEVGDDSTVQFQARLAYVHDLIADDVRVSVSESAVDGYTYSDDVPQTARNTVEMGLAAVMNVGTNLALGAGAGVSVDPELPAEGLARVGLTWRFKPEAVRGVLGH